MSYNHKIDSVSEDNETGSEILHATKQEQQYLTADFLHDL